VSYSYDSIRARIRNLSKQTGIKPTVLYNRYLLERFICRIAVSEHKEKIIIKGGLLISAIAGVDMRATKDLDATIMGNALKSSDFENIAHDIIRVDLEDNIRFQFVRSEEIMIDNNYPCYRMHLRASFGTMNAKVEIDMTTGDVITPKEVTFGFPSLFEDVKIPILAYNIETILAEKITAILDLDIFNTRAKDFYDIYLFSSDFDDRIDKTILSSALQNTLKHRNKDNLLDRAKDITHKILNSNDIQEHWRKYQDEYPYAKDVEFEQIAFALEKILGYAGIEIVAIE